MTKRRKIESEDEERPYNISTLKPEGIEDLNEPPKVNQDEYWTSIAQTKKAFSDLGFSVSEYEFEVYGPNGRKLGGNKGTENFFTRVSIEENPIQVQITTMKRLKAWEYFRNDKGRQQKRVKEFFVYTASIEGVDWVGNPLRARLENQGLCYEPDIRIKITTDLNGGQKADYTYDRLHDKYYIEWEGKKTVDNLLKKTGTNKDHIRYYCEVGSDPYSDVIDFRCGDFSYQQFTECSFEELEALAGQNGGPSGVSKWQDEKPKKVFVG